MPRCDEYVDVGGLFKGAEGEEDGFGFGGLGGC